MPCPYLCFPSPLAFCLILVNQLIEQLAKLCAVLWDGSAKAWHLVARYATNVWRFYEPLLANWFDRVITVMGVYWEIHGVHRRIVLDQVEGQLSKASVHFYAITQPIMNGLRLFHKTHYPTIAPYANPCILLLFRFLRWSYRAVNRPFDRFVAYYILFCRQRGIYVEEENLRMRWLTDGWMYIMFTSAVIYCICIFILHMWNLM